MSTREKWLNAENDRKKRELDEQLEKTLAQKVFPGAALKIGGEWAIVVSELTERRWRAEGVSKVYTLEHDEAASLWREEHQREYDELLLREAVELMGVEAPLDWDKEYKKRMSGELSGLPAVYRSSAFSRRGYSGLVLPHRGWGIDRDSHTWLLGYDGFMEVMPKTALAAPPIGEVLVEGAALTLDHNMLRDAPDGTVVRNPRSGPWDRTKGKWLSAFRVTDVLPPDYYEVLHWGEQRGSGCL